MKSVTDVRIPKVASETIDDPNFFQFRWPRLTLWAASEKKIPKDRGVNVL